MDFTNLSSLTIPEGDVVKIIIGDVVYWEKKTFADFNNLVPYALNTDGSVLDGKGYKTGYHWNSAILSEASAFTAIGFIPISGTVQHDIYVYGINFTGTSRNSFYLYNEAFYNLDGGLGLKDGFSNVIISSVAKLANNYFKIRTATYSTKVKYFTISGVTVSGITPIVTIDEPIFN